MKIKKERQNNNKIKKVKSIIDYTNYTKYREIMKTKPKKYKIKGRENWRKFCTTFFEVVADEMVEKDAGVLLDGLGYFFVFMPPRKLTYNFTGEEKFNFHTDHYMFNPMFYPTRKKGQYTFLYSMDNTFNFGVKDAIRDKLREGKRFKSYIYSFKRLINK